MILKDKKIYNLYYEDVQGEFTTVTRTKNSRSKDKKNRREYSFEARHASKKRKKSGFGLIESVHVQ